MPAWLAGSRGRAPLWWTSIGRAVTAEQFWLALALVTAVPIVLGIWLWRTPHSRVLAWMLLLIQVTLLLNALWHVGVAVLLMRGYVPGLLTAVGVNLPLSVYLLERARREGWVSRRALLGLFPASVVLHGLLLLGAVGWRG